MKRKTLAAVILAGASLWSSLSAFAADNAPAGPEIKLSPDLLEVLRAEMGQLSGAVQSVALSIATGDWASVEKAGLRMHDSYVIKKLLTPDQAAELREALPEGFKELDRQFHARAKRLAEAAEKRDPELAAFQFSRIVEGCALCHSRFAGDRFPGFSHGQVTEHGH